MKESFLAYGGWAVAVVVPFLMAIFPARKKQLDQATSQLVKTLQETVDAQTKEVEAHKREIEKLQNSHRENEKNIIKLETENKNFRELLLGQDKATIEWRNKSMRLTEETNINTSKLISLLEQHFNNMEKAAMKS